MKNFKLISIYDEKSLNKYNSDSRWKESDLLPRFSERTVCFSCNREFSFEELIELFLHGNGAEEIGSISIIAEHFPQELYHLICDRKNMFHSKKLRFLLEEVAPSYLPLVLPAERLMDYEFKEEFLNDIWVDILIFYIHLK